MVKTVLATGVGWPPYKPSKVLLGVVESHRPTLQVGILAHLKLHKVSTPTHMVAAGVGKQVTNIHTAIRELLDLGKIELAPSPPGVHHSARYYRLKGTS